MSVNSCFNVGKDLRRNHLNSIRILPGPTGACLYVEGTLRGGCDHNRRDLPCRRYLCTGRTAGLGRWPRLSVPGLDRSTGSGTKSLSKVIQFLSGFALFVKEGAPPPPLLPTERMSPKLAHSVGSSVVFKTLHNYSILSLENPSQKWR